MNNKKIESTSAKHVILHPIFKKQVFKFQIGILIYYGFAKY